MDEYYSVPAANTFILDSDMYGTHRVYCADAPGLACIQFEKDSKAMANPSLVPPRIEAHAAPSATTTPDLPVVGPTGPRKLVRPPLSKAPTQRRNYPRGEAPLLAHQALTDHAIASAGHDSSHAEAFYFQKQVQTQTLMCFVLDDGEKLEGYIEWYDRNVIKVRHSSRTLIYKSCIKYLYKAGEKTHTS
jgi:sRNA-binding regulator protein Hfq